jgi:hypothetical protein
MNVVALSFHFSVQTALPGFDRDRIDIPNWDCAPDKKLSV